MKTQNKKRTQTGLTPVKGLVVLVCVIMATAAYIGIAMGLGIVPLYAGFIFSLYYGGFKESDTSELPGALVGSLGGVLLATLLHVLPHDLGNIGIGIVGVLILGSVYALMMGWAAILFNYAFMLMLTVATIPTVQTEARFLGIACSILLAAAMLGGLPMIIRIIISQVNHRTSLRDLRQKHG